MMCRLIIRLNNRGEYAYAILLCVGRRVLPLRPHVSLRAKVLSDFWLVLR